MKLCWRCDKPIAKGDAYTPHDIPAPTGAGTTVFLHVKPCKRVPTQTTQNPVRH